MQQSLGLAVATTALVAAGASAARGQSPATLTQEPSLPSAPSVADEDPHRDRARASSGTTFRSLSLFNHSLTNRTAPTLALGPWASGVEMQCVGCRGFETAGVRPESTSLNAPWALQGRWRRQTTLGVVSTGFVGVRNYALPLSTAIRLGGDLNLAALSTSGAAVDSQLSQWSLTAGVEKTLAKRANGASVGVTGDLLIPFKTETVGVDPRTDSLTSPTVRFGIVLRW